MPPVVVPNTSDFDVAGAGSGRSSYSASSTGRAVKFAAGCQGLGKLVQSSASVDPLEREDGGKSEGARRDACLYGANAKGTFLLRQVNKAVDSRKGTQQRLQSEITFVTVRGPVGLVLILSS